MTKKCVECGREIPEKRLKLIPDTEHCVVCAQQLETSDNRPKLEISQEMHGGWFCEGIKYKLRKPIKKPL